MLSEPVSQNMNKFENRAFSFVAPKLWNSLPDYVRNSITLDSFKKNPSISKVLPKIVNYP